MSELRNSVFSFTPFRLDAEQRSLSRDGQPLALTPKEFDTLLVLVEAGGRVVDKEELISRVWPNSYVGDGSLARNISVLRKTLGDEVIETHRGRGYRITLPVAETNSGMDVLSAEAPRKQDQTAVRSAAIRPASRRWRPGVVWGSVVGLVLLTTFAASHFFGIRTAKARVNRLESAPLHSVVIEQAGGTDPLDSGFRLYRPEPPGVHHVVYNRETNGWDRWRLSTDNMNYYYRPLSDAEKDFALQRDWKLTCACALETGLGNANVDFAGKGPRFDIQFLQEGRRYFVALGKQISPRFEWAEKIEFPGIADVAHPHTYELRYDHLTRTASLWIDGTLRASGYHGHHQFQEDRGVVFGTSIYLDAQTGSFVTRDVRFETE